MKKIAITALLGLLLAPAYAENQQGFDQDEIYQQIQLTSEYIENEMSKIVLANLAVMSPEQERRLNTSKQAESAFNQRARRQLMQTWPAYMNRCYAGNAARLCAYRDIYFHQVFELVMKQVGDRQRVVPLHVRTRAWMRQNPQLLEQAAAEIAAVVHEAGL